MFYLIFQWSILFLLVSTLHPTVVLQSSNHTFQISFGFFCIYCGRPDYTYSHLSFIDSRSIVDCSQPYYIFCSHREAIGCTKHIKIFDYHIHIIKDCLRFTELSTDDLQCHKEFPSTTFPIKEKRFCCNDTFFCNQTFSIFFHTKQWFSIFFHLFLLRMNSIK